MLSVTAWSSDGAYRNRHMPDTDPTSAIIGALAMFRADDPTFSPARITVVDVGDAHNDTQHDIDIHPVRTWADYCRDAESAHPAMPEISDIPATEPPDLWEPGRG